MFFALIWFAVVSLALLWSLGAWAFHSIAAWTISNVGTLAGGTGAIEALQVPVWLAPWVPPELALLMKPTIAFLTPAIEAVLGWAPAMAGGLSIAVWTVWAIGAALLIVLGFLATGLAAVLGRRTSASPTSSRIAASGQ